MRNPPWLQSLILRLQSLQSLLSRSLSRLLPSCPRRWPSPQHLQPPHRSAEARQQKSTQASEDGAGRRSRPSTASRARAASEGSTSRASRGALGPGSARGACKDDARPRAGPPVHAAAGPVHGAACQKYSRVVKEP